MERPRADAVASRSLESLLLCWQSAGDTLCLADLITSITPFLERVARHVLRRQGIRDTSAIDDTTALVFDHLRRLPHEGPGERAVIRFDPNRSPCRCVKGCPAKAFLYRLAHDRAIDVARARRRRERHAQRLAQQNDENRISLRHEAALARGEEIEPLAAECCRLSEAIARLDPRLRSLIDFVIQGKSQVTIAHALGVCEGTVSRLRGRAIEELRRLLAEAHDESGAGF